MSTTAVHWARAIEARALTVAERRDRGAVPASSADAHLRGVLNLRAWLAALGDTNVSTLRALGLGQIDAPDWECLLGEVNLPSDQEPSPWVTCLIQLTDTITARGLTKLPDGVVRENEPLPFEDTFLPTVASALSDPMLTSAAEQAEVSKSAIAQIGRDLLVRLTHIAGHPLMRAFSLERASTPGSQANGQYHAFISRLRHGAIFNFFDIHPVTARALATTVLQWREATIELFERLLADRDELASQVPGGVMKGVRELRAGLSDPHDGGRTTVLVVFETGTAVLYKPRSGQLASAWNHFLTAIQSAGAPIYLSGPWVIDRATYHWTEHVSDITDVGETYFQQAGGLLCLFHVLCATDMHADNVIPTACGPVAVDLETLAHPNLANGGGKTEFDQQIHTAIKRAASVLGSSVVATGFLPDWSRVPGGSFTPVGGLHKHTSAVYQAPVWQHVNTDHMTVSVQSQQHFLRHTATTDLSTPTPAVIRGFAAMYDFLAANRELLLDGPTPLLHLFARCQLRVVLAPTQTYSVALWRSLSPSNAGDGARWSLTFDTILRQTAPSALEVLRTTVHDAVRDALANLDIPRFTCISTEMTIRCGAHEFPNALSETPIEGVYRRVRGLSEADKQFQIGLIKEVLDTDWLDKGLGEDGSHSMCTARQHTYPRLEQNERQLFESVAVQVGMDIQSAGLAAGDGVSWITSSRIGNGHGHRVDVIGSDIYSGSAGVALFFAALWSVTESPRFRHLSHATWSPVKFALRTRAGKPRQFGDVLGGLTGLGAIVYSLSRSSGLLGESGLIEDARRVAQMIEPLVNTCKVCDVVDGLAGTMLGLLALFDASGDAYALELAVLCGERVLNLGISSEDGCLSWKNEAGPSLLGMSHGAAGISMALSRLARASGREAFLSAAVAGILYEDQFFSTDQRNWPDLRPRPEDGPDASLWPVQWCHGSAGGVLARSSLLQAAPIVAAAQPEILARTISATQIVASIGLSPLDHLCCGNMGRSAALSEVGRALKRPDFVRSANEIAVDVALRYKQGLVSVPGAVPQHNVGLFFGLSGVGYQMLCLSYPELVPSVLSLA